MGDQGGTDPQVLPSRLETGGIKPIYPILVAISESRREGLGIAEDWRLGVNSGAPPQRAVNHQNTA